MQVRAVRVIVLLGLSATLLTCSASAQVGANSDFQVDIQVKVTYEDGRTPAAQIKLELLDRNDIVRKLLFTDKEGRADFIVDFSNGKADDLYLRATGKDIDEAVSDHIQLAPRERSRLVLMEVHSNARPAPQSKAPTTS